MLNFDFLEKGLGIVPPPLILGMIFLEKCFSYYTNFIVFTSGDIFQYVY